MNNKSEMPDSMPPSTGTIKSDLQFVTWSPEFSEWQCFLFGSKPDSGYGMSWRPKKGDHPNWFWRWMQFICFGNRWVKDKERK